MRDASAALWKVLRSNCPVVLVLYEDAGVREDLIAEMQSLLPPGSACLKSSDTRDAFEHQTSFLFLAPSDERDAVLTLDGRRDALLDRSAPIVLLLLRDGDGVGALPDAPALASWIQGNEVDPHRLEQIDVATERTEFQRRTGRPPEEWLKEYRAGSLPDTLENALWATRAALLEEPK